MMEIEERHRKPAEQAERLGKAVLIRSRTNLAQAWMYGDGDKQNALMKNTSEVRSEKQVQRNDEKCWKEGWSEGEAGGR